MKYETFIFLITVSIGTVAGFTGIVLAVLGELFNDLLYIFLGFCLALISISYLTAYKWIPHVFRGWDERKDKEV